MKVADSSLHGKGVFAPKPCECNGVVFIEHPLYFLQSLANRKDVLSCSSCSVPMGSLETQAQLLTRDTNRQQICQTILERDSTKSSNENETDKMCLCRNNCGEIYCCEECGNDHWNSHKYLCTGLIPDEEAENHPLIKFKIHSIQTNEIFLLVADVFAKLLHDHESGVKTLEESVSFFQSYVHNLWWDVVTIPKKKKEKEFRNTLKKLCQESYDLLSSVLKLKENSFDNILSCDFMSRLIGTFEQNNVGVKLVTPLQNQINSLSVNSEVNKIEQALTLANHIFESLEECEDDDEEYEDIDEDEEIGEENNDEENNDKEGENELKLTGVKPLDDLKNLIESHGLDTLFPPLDGAAFYKTICRINHSCVPNVIVKYSSYPRDKIICNAENVDVNNRRVFGLMGQVTALREIQSGEELVQSYIDNDQDYSSRQAALADYGFICKCQKCLDENPENK